MALLSVPLAFTFADAQEGNGQLAADPWPCWRVLGDTLDVSYFSTTGADIHTMVAPTGFGVPRTVRRNRAITKGGRNAGGVTSEGMGIALCIGGPIRAVPAGLPVAQSYVRRLLGHFTAIRRRADGA